MIIKNQMRKLEKLSKLIKNFKIEYEFLINDKVLYNGYFKNIYDVKNIEKQKPKFPFYIIIILTFFFLPAIFSAAQNNDIISSSIALPILIILLIVLNIINMIFYIKKVKKWQIIQQEITNLKIESCNKFNDITEQIEKYKNILPNNLLFFADKIYEDMNKNNFEDIDLYLKNIEKNTPTINVYNNYNTNYCFIDQKKYCICNYCGTTNNKDNTNCQNCGANL